MKVLITGCAGYLGCILCHDLLDAGFEVEGVDSLRHNQGRELLGILGRPGFHFRRENVLSLTRDDVGDVDAVVHLAALVGMPVCRKDPEGADRVNRLATEHVVSLVSRGQQVVYAMTNSGYGAPGDALVDESWPLEPLSVYGRTKVEGERAVLDAGGCSLRFATVFGCSPRMRFDLLVNHFVSVLRKRVMLPVYQPGFRRNCVHVRDASGAILHALSRGLSGVYNVALPEGNRTKMELALAAAAATGRSPLAVVEGDGIDPDGRDCWVSSEKLLASGFRFRFGLEQGMAEVARACALLGGEEIHNMRNA